MQQYHYPSDAANSNASVGPNGQPIPASSTLIGGENPSGDLQQLQTDVAGDLLVAVTGSVLPTGAATSANQTNGSQKTQVVDGAGAVWGPTTSSGGVDYFPVTSLEAAANGAAVAARTLQVGGSDGTDLRTLSTDATGKLNINNISGTVSLPTGASTAANQATEIASLASIDAKLTNPLPVSGTVSATQGTSPWVDNVSQFGGSNVVTGVGNSGAGIPRVTVSSDSSITNITGTISLPTGAATEATLASLNGKVVAVNTGAVVVSSSALPSGAATEATLATRASEATIAARLTGSLVPAAYDEIDLTYVPSGPGSGQIQTAVYKLAASTVKTITITYDGSDRIDTVVAS